MTLPEAIVYLLASSNHGMKTDQIAHLVNEHYKYTFPNGKHPISEFEELLSYTGGLFYSSYSDWNHDGGQSSGIYANFHIETNVK